jgi:hypothetical protein
MIARHDSSTALTSTPARTEATPAACASRTTSYIWACVSVGSPTMTVRVMSEW